MKNDGFPKTEKGIPFGGEVLPRVQIRVLSEEQATGASVFSATT